MIKQTLRNTNTVLDTRYQSTTNWSSYHSNVPHILPWTYIKVKDKQGTVTAFRSLQLFLVMASVKFGLLLDCQRVH